MRASTGSDLRRCIDDLTYADETACLASLRSTAALDAGARAQISDQAATWVREIRTGARPGLMEVFLAEYGLSTDEGVALMCLAEALLRVPDTATIDALIEDKIAPSDWARHLGQASSPLVNASTWALMLTGKVLDDSPPGPAGHLRAAIKRLGEPVIRTAVGRAMKEMGAQFVLGETITAAMARGAAQEAQGYTYSYDMLGEAAQTEADAARYHLAYSEAITALASAARSGDIRTNPGISVKLSALHPRYDVLQADSARTALVPRLAALAGLAKSAGIGLNVDAEEADRLALSCDVIEEVLSDPSLAGWDGFGVVVQAYGKRAPAMIDWLAHLAERLDRRLMVRLVKGAYWDTEIKTAQVLGLDAFPVFTSKAATDVSYIACARQLLARCDRLYPQFATHNAHTAAAVVHMAQATGVSPQAYEFQRLHGMGEALHALVKDQQGTACRIYAPVGAHRDLLAYLVRRLLENGANSSFVNQIVDADVPPETVAADPFAAPLPGSQPGSLPEPLSTSLPTGADLYAPERPNAEGFDLRHAPTLARIDAARGPFRDHLWQAEPLLAAPQGPSHPATAAPGAQGATITPGVPDAPDATATPQPLTSPSDPRDALGTVLWATPETAAQAAHDARPWDAPPTARAAVLNRAADLYETHFGEIFALLHREAGKCLPDAVAELREAVDFLRYYAARAEDSPVPGCFACISPWNFPLAIFTGQIAAALATGQAVLAKPAEQTPLIAHKAAALLHAAGVPRTVLQLLPGDGAVGAALTAAPEVTGVAFTGATETAQRIHRTMAQHLAPGAPLIAETGGLNAMIVDSTALPEQAVQAIIESAFQSAGQRCSALRCLYVQEDVADDLLTMLRGAMAVLVPGDPWLPATDVGPVIDAAAKAEIAAHIATARAEGRVLAEGPIPAEGHHVAPTLISVTGIGDLGREIFGPVLHVARFAAKDLDKVISDINATGYGLTFGLHTRIDDRVQHVADRVAAGNLYVNRNQIGAIVGSQPFGGEGLSGTGPKAGGPHYLARFGHAPAPMVEGAAPARAETPPAGAADTLNPADTAGTVGTVTPETLAARIAEVAASGKDAVSETVMPGPTGESNLLRCVPRPPLLCLGPGPARAAAQAAAVHALGGRAVEVHDPLAPEALETLEGLSGVIWWGDTAQARHYRRALAARPGALLPLITGAPDRAHACHERHICIDTTAAGGNAALLAGQS